MFSLLNHFEHLVCDSKQPDKCIFSSFFKSTNSLDVENHIHQLERTIKREAYEIAISGNLPKVIKSQIRTLQQSIIRVLNHLHHRREHCKLNSVCNKNKHKAFLDGLMKSLEFLEHQFPKYFNHNATIPHVLFIKKKRKLNIHLYFIENKLPYADELSLFFKPFKRISQHHRKYSFQQIDYLLRLIFKISHIVNSGEDEYSTLFHKLLIVCIQNNFNATSTYDFITQYITNQLKNESDYNKHLLILMKFQKKIEQTHQNNRVQYTNKYCPLKKSLLHWISKEVAYYNYLKQLLAEVAITPKNIIDEQTFPKIKTSLSVPQMACFVRQLIDQNIIIPSNKEKTIRFFSEILSSKNVDNVSSKSFRNLYFTPELKTLERTKELFLKLFKSVDIQ